MSESEEMKAARTKYLDKIKKYGALSMPASAHYTAGYKDGSELLMDVVQLCAEAEHRLATLTRQRDLAVSELETVANGFDCDNDAHRYGSYCRKCEAKKALSTIKGEVKE